MHDFDVRTFPEHRQEILELLIELWNDWQPDLVFQPSLHDVHQDHQTIAAEGLRAFKRTTILGYEIPWNNFDFAYQAYFALERAHIERKVAALAKYASQQHRRYANPRVRLEPRADARHQREPRVRRGVPGVPRDRLTTTTYTFDELADDHPLRMMLRYSQRVIVCFGCSPRGTLTRIVRPSRHEGRDRDVRE